MKNVFWYFVLKTFPKCFQFLFAFFNVFDRLLVCVLFGRNSRFWASFVWFIAFLHDFDQKSVLFEKSFCYGIWSQKSLPSRFQHFTTDFDIFDRVSIFLLFDRFGRLWASFEWLKAFWHKFVKQIT